MVKHGNSRNVFQHSPKWQKTWMLSFNFVSWSNSSYLLDPFVKNVCTLILKNGYFGSWKGRAFDILMLSASLFLFNKQGSRFIWRFANPKLFPFWFLLQQLGVISKQQLLKIPTQTGKVINNIDKRPMSVNVAMWNSTTSFQESELNAVSNKTLTPFLKIILQPCLYSSYDTVEIRLQRWLIVSYCAFRQGLSWMSKFLRDSSQSFFVWSI